MKNYTLLLSKIFILFILLFSCSKADEQQCVYSNPTYVTSVNAATYIGKVNETINIEVNFPVSSGCGGFGKFIDTVKLFKLKLNMLVASVLKMPQ